MIHRYEVPAISRIWSDESRFRAFLKVEVAHLQTLEDQKLIPSGTAKQFACAQIDPQRISEIEQTTNHDLIAFCTSVTEQFAPEQGRFFHFGLTSSDVIDTAHALLIKESMVVILQDLQELLTALRAKIEATRDIICIGRSHGIHAEAMIFAQKFLSYLTEGQRRELDWTQTMNDLTGQLSGAVGNYTVISPEQEEFTLKTLGLEVEPVSTQVIPRDRYAKIVLQGGMIAALLERMALEFRLLQHSDVDEVREGFSTGQKGSSTMPHKKNPISSENIMGLCRVLRSHLHPALENCALWHERDISHSSVERLLLPDHFGLLSYALRRMKSVVTNLVVDRRKIEARAGDNEKIYSSLVLHRLIEFNPSITREEIYSLVQAAFFKSTNKTELTQHLSRELTTKGLSHELSRWLDFQELKDHYLRQFEKVLKRI